MKRIALATLLIMVFFLCFSGPGHAVSCPDWHGYCYADSGKGKLLGPVTVGMCWTWKVMFCAWCSGDSEPARHCDGKYSKCQGNCWACNGKRGESGVSCWDRNGNQHGGEFTAQKGQK